jgi:CBS domain-containing protein
MSEEKKDNKMRVDANVSAAIRYACKRQFGVLDSNFLCQSLSLLNLRPPISVQENDSLQKVIETLRDNKAGCVLVLNDQDTLVGIFSERDLVLKVAGLNIDLNKTVVSDYMTTEPITQPPDCTIAYALNLMSHGGFRHLPVVDEQGTILGVISTKDVVDFIVATFSQDLLQFTTDLGLET